MLRRARATDKPDAATTLLDSAFDYARRGWSLIPVREKQAARLWKPFQSAAADPDTLRRLFTKRGIDGLAVITGSVSGGLAVRDFDQEAAYDQWAEAHSTDAARLPTVKTARGYHVYGTFDHDQFHQFSDGELRADSRHYVVLPPSRHPVGDLYHWLIPLPRLGTSLPELPVSLTQGPAQQTQAISRQTQANTLHAPAQGIDTLIVLTLPAGPGERNRRVFDLARGLLGLLGRHADPAQLRRIVQDWHRLALPFIRTKPFDETWTDFITAWKRVKHPGGASLLAAIAAADSGPVPAAAGRYDSTPMHRLIALCAQLAAQWGDRPFPLGCRTAGAVLGIKPAAAHRLLETLEFDGIIKLAMKGSQAQRRASEWHFTGGDR